MVSETIANLLRHALLPVRSTFYRLDKRRRRRSGADCVSFPKSGRTWLKFMLDQLDLPVRFTHAGKVRERPPLGSYDPTPHFDPERRTVFLHRDPRDTAVSFYFEVTKRIRIFEGSFSEYLRDPRYGIEAIIEFNDAWLDLLAGEPNALIVTYEDMHAAPQANLRRIADHIARDRHTPDDAKIAAAIEAGSFRNMRQQEGSLFAWLLYGQALQPRDGNDRESFKVRRGKVGGFSDYFSDADRAFADTALAASPHYRHLAGTSQAQAAE